MQTFLPFADFDKSVRVIDPSRLGNQIYRECVTLIRGKWPNHPACKMWVGHEYHLAQYALCGLRELTKRGRHYPKWYDYFNEEADKHGHQDLPWWLGCDLLHSTHRANLIRKDPVYYGQFKWTEKPMHGYAWPQEPGIIKMVYSDTNTSKLVEVEYGEAA